MRLIDADKLIKDIQELWDYKTVDDITATTVLKQTITDIENQPTVKAITVEWILNYRKNNQGEITYYTIDAIDHMLCEWCKRNNIDMWDMIDSWEKENETTG